MGLDLLFPRSCVICDAPCDGRQLHFCTACHQKLRYQMAEPACPRCAHTVGPFGIHDGRCFACRDLRPRLDNLVRVAAYRDEMAPLIRKFKFSGRDELDHHLGGLLAEVIQLATWSESTDALIYVPTHWTHSFGRVHYVPKVLARVVSRFSGIPTATVFRRVAGGPHQFDVPRTERRRNIRGKFAMIPGAAVEGARICLIDDVSTTGATLNECARVLKSAGALAVTAAVIGKVDTRSSYSLPAV